MTGQAIQPESTRATPNGAHAPLLRGGRWLSLALLAASLLLSGCSPEADRARGGGPGGDPGNTSPSVELHGNRDRNNPSFKTPLVGKVPRDAKGVPGFWASP